MREKIKAWLNVDNGHDLDDEMLYNLVYKSRDSKLVLDAFSAAAQELEEQFNKKLDQKFIENSYSRYEDLWYFQRWLNTK